MRSRDIDYRLKVIESSSPLTKRPSTGFRLAVLGILQKDKCYVGTLEAEQVSGVSKASPLPILSLSKALECDISISPNSIVGNVGDVIDVTISHGENSDIFKEYVYNDSRFSIKDTSDGIQVKLLEETSTSLRIGVNYEGCLECTLDIDVEATIPVGDESSCEGAFNIGTDLVRKLGGITVVLTPTTAEREDRGITSIELNSSDTSIVTVTLRDNGDFELNYVGIGEATLETVSYFTHGRVCRSSIKVTVT